MGYTTHFDGKLFVKPGLPRDAAQKLNNMSKTRRVRRDVRAIAKVKNMSVEEVLDTYGVEGEFFFEEKYDNVTVVNSNVPPLCQHGLWCDWMYNEKEHSVEWNGSEKFYYYVDWLFYIDKEFIQKCGCKFYSGEIRWKGEDSDDEGLITVDHQGNIVISEQHMKSYEINFSKQMKMYLYENMNYLFQYSGNCSNLSSNHTIYREEVEKNKLLLRYYKKLKEISQRMKSIVKMNAFVDVFVVTFE